MSLATILSPMLTGTVKSNSPIVATSNTISPSYLITGATTSSSGGYRNTGTGDATQFMPIPQATLTALATGAFPYTFYPFYTVGGVNYPMVIPAGSYINSATLDITIPFTFGGAPTGFTLAVNGVGATGTTFATPAAFVNHGTGAALTSWTTAQRNQVGSGTNFTWGTGASAVAYLANTGNTDTLIQFVLTFTGGASPTITAGAFTFSINYCFRNYDATWYPQTSPGAPQTTFPASY